MTTVVQHRPSIALDTYLHSLPDEDLRSLKLNNADASVGSNGHQIFQAADRILRSREGTYLARKL